MRGLVECGSCQFITAAADPTSHIGLAGLVSRRRQPEMSADVARMPEAFGIVDRGATSGAAGKIDQDQIFYLMSRGLSYNQAEQVIVNGFFESVLQQIPLEYLRNQLQESIAGKLQLN